MAKKESLPYMPMYVGDIMGATQGWDSAAVGIYFTLLCAAWATDGISSLSDPVLAARAKESDREMVLSILKEKFQLVDGRWRNSKMEDVRDKSLTLKDSRAKGAAITNAKRWGNKSPSESLSDTPSESPSVSTKVSPPTPTPTPTLSLTPTPTPKESEKTDVELVFDHWRSVWGHHKASLDAKRKVVIKRALMHYSVEDLLLCISGYRNSPHHTGQNDRQTVYDDIGLFLRDSAHVDAGIRFASSEQKLTSQLSNHNVRVLAEWSPRDGETSSPPVPELNGSARGGVRQGTLARPDRAVLERIAGRANHGIPEGGGQVDRDGKALPEAGGAVGEVPPGRAGNQGNNRN